MFKNKKYGFTIIEVVLVLAISGLIFLMVFIALPALQRNQRDTQRKNDMATLQAALNNYKSNNRGTLPLSEGGDSLRAAMARYMDTDNFRDPSGSRYFISSQSGVVARAHPFQYYADGNYEGWMPHYMGFRSRARCTAGNTEDFGGLNNFAIFILLESGGAHCLDG
ncbi:MAG: type II secretion system protein [Candidatus Sacchiramonaceae bacterium]|nr:type II secretion system protein [Candidatus Saccharimonadaceae bacterium]